MELPEDLISMTISNNKKKKKIVSKNFITTYQYFISKKMECIYYCHPELHNSYYSSLPFNKGPGWLNELGRWI